MSTASIQDSNIVIVGTGLAGYTTAAALAEAGCENITVYDARKDPTMFETDRAYSQVIYQTGQRLIAKLPGFENTFRKEAYCQYVRVDKYISSDGSSKVTSSYPPAGPVYWLLKTRLLQLLDSYVKDRYPNVKFITGAEVTDVVFDKNSGGKNSPAEQPKLLVNIDGRQTMTGEFDLLVACDGFKSTIRSWMASHDDQMQSKNGMSIYSKDSPSTGLRHKGIILNDSPIVSSPGAPPEYAEPSVIYTMFGQEENRPKNSVFNMILLPVCAGKDVDRRAAIAMPQGHKLLSITDVDEAYDLFKENFPQLRVKELISREQMKTFIEFPASTFPPIERPMSLVAHFRNTAQGCGVIFVGDSAHSFPPDAAQGTNSTFQDVEDLLEIVSNVGEHVTVDQLLVRYEEARDEETWLLSDIISSAASMQYKQNKLGYMRYTVNKQVRGTLSKILPRVFSEDLDSLVRQGLSYRAIRHRDRLSILGITVLVPALITVIIAVFASI